MKKWLLFIGLAFMFCVSAVMLTACDFNRQPPSPGGGQNPPSPNREVQLAVPSNLGVSGMTLSWDSVSGATRYRVQIGGETRVAGGNSFELNNFDLTPQGNYSVRVRAEGGIRGNTRYTDSGWSAAISFISEVDNRVRQGLYVITAAGLEVWDEVIGGNGVPFLWVDGESLFFDGDSSRYNFTRHGGVYMVGQWGFSYFIMRNGILTITFDLEYQFGSGLINEVQIEFEHIPSVEITGNINAPTAVRFSSNWALWNWVSGATLYRVYVQRPNSNEFEFAAVSTDNSISIGRLGLTVGASIVRLQSVRLSRNGARVDVFGSVFTEIASIQVDSISTEQTHVPQIWHHFWNQNLELWWMWMQGALSYRLYILRPGSDSFQLIFASNRDWIDFWIRDWDSGTYTFRIQTIGGGASFNNGHLVIFTDSEFGYLTVEI